MNYQIPEGFIHDPSSGLYFKDETVTGQDGRPVRLVTWYDPTTGQFNPVYYEIKEETAPVKTQTQDTQKQKSKGALIAIIASSVCVVSLAVVGVIGFQMGWFNASPSAQSIPVSTPNSNLEATPAPTAVVQTPAPVNPIIGETEDGKIIINDLYEGTITIPKCDIPTNEYNPDAFSMQNGFMTYADGPYSIGIDVSSNDGTIDWREVKESGIDFAIIRSSFRYTDTGEITQDQNFISNIEAATAAGIEVGVYFYSQAVTTQEAVAEAEFLIEQISPYHLDYPIIYIWSEFKGARTDGVSGEDVSVFTKTFCDMVSSQTSHEVMINIQKSLAYDFLNLELLKDYDFCLEEHEGVPSFYYDFPIWSYSGTGVINGIDAEVYMYISLKDY